MRKKFIIFLLAALFLSSCAQPVNASSKSNEPASVTTAPATATATQLPSTQTPSPTATTTLDPTPDFTLVGLPVEETGTTVFDFVTHVCDAEWFTQGQKLSCPGDESQRDAGYVMPLDGSAQGLLSNIGILLTYPPQVNYETISSKYPSFIVQKGDRFRAVLTCRAHTFCDVQFDLGYFDEQGHTGLKHWRYLFVDSAVVVDYPLDAIAGKTVQFDLAVQSKGNRSDGSAVWIAPHIYRPAQ